MVILDRELRLIGEKKMNIQKKLSLLFVLSMLALFLSAAITASLALKTDPDSSSTKQLISSQNFEEMLPGVFVSYSWYNYTESYTDVWTDSYENVSIYMGKDQECYETPY